MSAELGSFLRGTIPLDILILFALYLALTRAPEDSNHRLRRRLVVLAGAALAVQVVHFTEEWMTGFNHRFPALLGLEPWSLGLWAGFNLTWIAIWVAALAGLHLGWRPALFPVWFLGLGCAINGVAHPLLALAVGGYFPGLWTSPATGVAAWWLVRGLARFTKPRRLF